MKECTYYDLLGVPMDATDEEITNAKNFLVKKLHPDANIDSKFDTTTYIQNILYAYRILSNPDKRRVYDRRIRCLLYTSKQSSLRKVHALPFQAHSLQQSLLQLN